VSYPSEHGLRVVPVLLAALFLAGCGGERTGLNAEEAVNAVQDRVQQSRIHQKKGPARYLRGRGFYSNSSRRREGMVSPAALHRRLHVYVRVVQRRDVPHEGGPGLFSLEV
jgi:hypothetical protein